MFTGAAVVMGVASSGKTLVASGIAERLGISFVEGDRLHAPESIAKMSAGIALNDEDRWPWLARIGEALREPGGKVAACSALKKTYRLAIARSAGRPVRFVFLKGSRALLEQRIASRAGHFMPAALLASQFATLEEPTAEEIAIGLDIARPPEELIEAAIRFLAATQPSIGSE